MPAWLATALPMIAFGAVFAIALRFSVPRKRTRPVRLKVLARAVLPNRIIRSRSGRADIGWFLFSNLLIGSLIGWALISGTWVTEMTQYYLASVFASPAEPLLPDWAGVMIVTAALFVAYEFAYWGHHYLSHKIPVLWHFHKVHHSAESLSPLTNFRVHPLETILLYNASAAIMGFTAGAMNHLLGISTHGYMLQGQSLFVYLSIVLFSHLQHTHLWISFPGKWGRWLLSPAHHQLHHSVEARHYDCNFGSAMAIFDRLFGTLYMPSAKREKLAFGVTGLDHDPHSLSGGAIMPFVEAAREFAPQGSGRRVNSVSA